MTPRFRLIWNGWRYWRGPYSVGEARHYGWRLMCHCGPFVLCLGRAVEDEDRLPAQGEPW